MKQTFPQVHFLTIKKVRLALSWNRLEKLADALDFPKEFFLRPITPGAKLTGPRLFRASCNLTKKAADQAETRLSWMSECIVFAKRFMQTPEPTFLHEF